MGTEEFDDIVRKKMEQPVQADDPRAWDLFMLSAMERGEEALFEDTSADEIVRSALNDYKVEYNEESWESLSKKLDYAALDAEPLAVQAKFDKIVSNSLKDITRKYDAATWPKLAARIDAEEKYLKHYYRAKAIETLLFCFFVLTLFQFIKAGKLTTPVLGNQVQETASILPASPSTDVPAVVNQPVLIKSSGNSRAIPMDNIQSAGPGQNQANSTIIDQVIDPQVSYRQYIQFTSLQKSPVYHTSFLDHNSGTGLNDKLPNVGFFDPSGYNEARIDNQMAEIPISRSVKLANTLAKAVVGTWKFGMYTHSDYNQIYLPDQYLLIYGIKSPLYSAKTVKSVGYGAGFKAHYLKNRMGAEIGLGYSKRSYSPNRKYYLDPFWNINFKRIEYDIVEMPISLKYTSKGNTRLKTYAMAGVNANFIAKAIYDVLPEIKQVTTSNDIRLTVEQNYIKSRVEDQFTVLDKRRALLYGQGSLGMEWKVNSKMDIYSQLTYSQRVLTKQFGPNWDQFRSLSLELGVKTSIN